MSDMTERAEAWQQLRDALATHEVQSSEVLNALTRVWDDFDVTSMYAHKLPRWESPEWVTPVLSFSIERHGAVALGSKVAELQTWFVDTETETITPNGSGRRRIAKVDKAFDVQIGRAHV